MIAPNFSIVSVIAKVQIDTIRRQMLYCVVTMWIPNLSVFGGPRYKAIAEALAVDLRSGRLKPGDRLPTHRELAYRLGVTVGTVTRAYAEAQRRGLVDGHVGRGSFLAGLPGPGQAPGAQASPAQGLPLSG